MDLGLKGRVAIVAAASKGLGCAVATELAREGTEVAICARSAANLEKAASGIRQASGREVFWRALDVTDAAKVQGFVAEVEERYGRVDICVTNAGGPPAKTFLEISAEEWNAAVSLTLLDIGLLQGGSQGASGAASPEGRRFPTRLAARPQARSICSIS